MRTNLLTVAVFVGLFTACGSSKNGAPVTCGTLTCKVNEVCSTSSSAPVCVCAEGYTGSTCSSCKSGYTMNSGVCILAPIDCTRTTVCGSHGTCANNTCTCTAGYTGTACETCADGFQDNDKNGTCLATCLNPVTTVSCQPPQTCADTSGRAICSCPAGSTGTTCQSCLSGYVRQMNGACIMCPANTTGEACAECVTGYIKQPDGTCAPCPMFSTGINCESCVTGYAKDPTTGQCVKSCTANSQCGVHGFCDTSLPVPNCTCQAGYTGATCADCAPNYVRDANNQCILAAIPAGTALIGAGLIAGVNSLLAIDPTANTVTAIRPLPSTSITQLAADVDSKVLYALDSTGIKKLDLSTGTLTTVTALASSNNLTWGPGGLFSIPSLSPYLLKRINVMSGGIADLGTTGLANVQALAYDASSGALIAARWTASPELHRVSASDGVATPMGTITFDPAALPPGNTRIGIAADPNTGFIYAATSVGRTPQALFTKHCSQVAAGIGLTGYDTAQVTAMEYPTNGIGVGLTKVIGSQAASGKEVVAYASNAAMGATPAILRIETANPDAFVCLMTRDENLKVVLAATAKFAGIAITGNRPRLAMEVEGVREVTSPLVHIALQSETYLDPSVRAYAIDKVYTSAEWATQKKLPYITSLWGSDTSAPTRLVQIDLATNKPARIVSFNGVELQNLLSPWKP